MHSCPRITLSVGCAGVCLPDPMRIRVLYKALFDGAAGTSPPWNQLQQYGDSTKLDRRALDPSGARRTFTLARILVVDDDAAVQLTIRLLLERAGHSVVTASDGRKGLALCQTGNFDLLFLDIFMPGMDGFETMRMVRQQRSQIPIIVISGRPVSPESD